MQVDVELKINSYPKSVQSYLFELRSLVLTTAKTLNLGEVEESLKWGEPSYSVKGGSPIRIDWKPKSPNCIYLFFVCSTKLVDTFKELYGDELIFEGNRAIVLNMSERLPIDGLRHCIELALNYEKVKHLPLLGA